MKLLLLGADGQLGRELRTALAPLGEVLALGSGHDVSDEAVMRRALDESQPDAIVNASAYTAVDRAEQEPERAYAVNARACEMLAREARARGAWFIHYSTDYVFDGSGSKPWTEDDETRPLGVYGASKLAGEQAIREHSDRYVILRTSWVYEAGRSNFIGAILKAACARDALTVVEDQWGTPTRARAIARTTAAILPRMQPSQAGLYHFAAAGETNRFELARFSLECAAQAGWPLRARANDVSPVRTADVPSPAQRPLNSRMDCSRFDRVFGVARAPWQPEVSAAIAEWPAMPPS
jgi:dTDP-4-dehydrorhamnose reductase